MEVGKTMDPGRTTIGAQEALARENCGDCVGPHSSLAPPSTQSIEASPQIPPLLNAILSEGPL